ncbi:MAG: type II secretion system protein [Zoogloeaceae bacterium]|nr:type II secretion system protein [Zoogloeaceae bacterium]
MTKRSHQGFTLTELAIVLVIVGLLLTTLMPSLTVQTDLKHYNETTQVINEARDALIGYAMTHTASDGKPYLPCPAADDSGIEATRTAGACPAEEGRFPWSTLGVARWDSWNNRIRYRVRSTYTNSTNGFTLSSAGTFRVCEDAACTIVIASTLPVVLLSHGKNGLGAFNSAGGTNTAPTGTDELENSDNDTDFVSHSPTSDFDDSVAWLPATILFNRMIAAGRLP